MQNIPLQIHKSRLLKNIDKLSKIGLDKNGHRYRGAFTSEDMEARIWLKRKIAEAGLIEKTDSAGNIFGIFQTDENKDNPVVLSGSHIDTVKNAGAYDGTLGVLSALEALRCLNEQNIVTKHPLAMIAFSDEEGSMIGSKAITQKLHHEQCQNLYGIQGQPITHLMKAAGFNPDNIAESFLPSENIKAFIELHAEQGPYLERKQQDIGIVSAIVGLFKWQVTLLGEANHAGTTPMDMRRDALTGAARFATSLRNILEHEGAEHSVATIGHLEVLPGSPNIIPAQVTFTLEARDGNQDTLHTLGNALKQEIIKICSEENLEYSIDLLSEIDAASCDAEIISCLGSLSEELGYRHCLMPSGALHDAQNMARHTATGMIFVPSVNGISHNPEEKTNDEDIVNGANLLLRALYKIAH